MRNEFSELRHSASQACENGKHGSRASELHYCCRGSHLKVACARSDRCVTTCSQNIVGPHALLVFCISAIRVTFSLYLQVCVALGSGQAVSSRHSSASGSSSAAAFSPLHHAPLTAAFVYRHHHRCCFFGRYGCIKCEIIENIAPQVLLRACSPVVGFLLLQ